MKLKQILNEVLNEIGDRINLPTGVDYNIQNDLITSKFKFLNDTYSIKINIKQDNIENNKLILDIDVLFYIESDSAFQMTNKNQPLALLSNISGIIIESLKKYKEYHYDSDLEVQIHELTYTPKSEEEDEYADDINSLFGPINKRDKLYRVFIEKFAKIMNGDVVFFRFDPNKDEISARFIYDE